MANAVVRLPYIVTGDALDPEGVHDVIGGDDVRTTLAAHRTKLVVHAVDVLDTKVLRTNATPRRLLAAASP